jgi:hypothetical protein
MTGSAIFETLIPSVVINKDNAVPLRLAPNGINLDYRDGAIVYKPLRLAPNGTSLNYRDGAIVYKSLRLTPNGTSLDYRDGTIVHKSYISYNALNDLAN